MGENPRSAVDVVREFWRLMATSDFVAAGRIVRQVEYGPEPYPAPPHRRHLVEPIR